MVVLAAASWWFRSDLDVTKTTIDVNPSTFDVLGINVRMDKERFLLVNIYRPPDTNMNTFISELTDLLDSVAGRYTIFMGDFNCPDVTCDCVDTRVLVLLHLPAIVWKLLMKARLAWTTTAVRTHLTLWLKLTTVVTCVMCLLSVQVSQTTVYWKRVWTVVMNARWWPSTATVISRTWI